MQKEELKKLTAEVSKDCWKKLKILSVQKDISLTQCVKEILEKYASKSKNVETISAEDN